VTFDAADARALLGAEEVVHAHSPTNRNVPNLVRNVWLALRVVPRLRPRVVLTTGAGVAVPFAWVARLLGARVVFVESLTRIDRPSLTYRLLRPAVSRTYVQWPELQEAIPDGRFCGTVFDAS
jgi:UDP-N-acetylglucosamine:LPS N-acetylglucosamine transferase